MVVGLPKYMDMQSSGPEQHYKALIRVFQGEQAYTGHTPTVLSSSVSFPKLVSSQLLLCTMMFLRSSSSTCVSLPRALCSWSGGCIDMNTFLAVAKVDVAYWIGLL